MSLAMGDVVSTRFNFFKQRLKPLDLGLEAGVLGFKINCFFHKKLVIFSPYKRRASKLFLNLSVFNHPEMAVRP